ncbi:hypothetical protein RYH73_25450 [Olivibacter sp. CPCC 100613]|uniref:hypothetical protein n=1 Tax=Olivibacter sp. CPCC 100613 TaxID=3079931 RepID=UPI002FF6B05C
METLVIKIRDKNAIKLIQDLELLNLIQIVSDKRKAKKAKLSEALVGSISKEEAETYQKAVKTMREEWERSSY